MNGFAERGLDEGNFGSAELSVSSFDAFPKTKQTYQTQTRNGGIYTLLTFAVMSWLFLTETWSFFRGTTTHTFSVESGVAHTLQLNLDIVVPMPCEDLHVNIQDASGDRIHAGQTLNKEQTVWDTWAKMPTGAQSQTELQGLTLHDWWKLQAQQYRGEEDVHDFLKAAKKKPKFPLTPRILRGVKPDACRIFGSIEGNKVQGDFHITARGHGYVEMGGHLDHKTFNFSHYINELSFGPFYPSLINPLDQTRTTTNHNFYRYQYFLSIVPTIYTDALDRLIGTRPPAKGDKFNPAMFAPHTVFTNQYAVTEQSREITENNTPGIFFKFDIEPILLIVHEEWGGFLRYIVRMVNVIAGVLVAGGWMVSLADWLTGYFNLGGKRRRLESTDAGLLHGGSEKANMD